MNFPVYSSYYKLFGKIDEYDEITQELIEYKNNINKVYDGYKMQLYAQARCLETMGYQVKKIKLKSIQTKEEIEIALPSRTEMKKFEKLIENIRYYDIFKYLKYQNKCQNKCRKCIYKELCNDD
ncbi:MAG: type V CRISPR-associated protein Cas4 [Candidatus Pacebacteria bacterium]|nr:type V CRISPR-associated protein Cas4 [Candidatus Paceibacterota bacterium]